MVWTLGLVLAAGAISQLIWGHEMSLGVALGALVGIANIWLLAKALGTVLSNAQEYRPSAGQTWVLPGVILLKWPFILLALAIILWYMPARPEGVAVGALLALVGASIAAISANRANSTSPS
jgi:ABC-type antimicrobial peptide transport system permease subunit